MSDEYEKDLDQMQELFEFLQGRVPEGYKIRRGHMPKLSPEQAWTVCWYLGNLYWQPKDTIERCCVCGDLYHSEVEGACLDFGKAPYHFCESCMESEPYEKKVRSKLNPENTSGLATAKPLPALDGSDSHE